MRIRLVFLATAAVLALVATAATAAGPAMNRNGPGPGGGMCYNPLAPDADGDGIPNGLDPDYAPPRDGSGRGLCRAGAQLGWFDILAMRFGFGPGAGYGPGDGTGNGRVGPRDGTGFGPGPGTGSCDGTGPHGLMRRGR
jgi:hypothetical protein